MMPEIIKDLLRRRRFSQSMCKPILQAMIGFGPARRVAIQPQRPYPAAARRSRSLIAAPSPAAGTGATAMRGCGDAAARCRQA